MNISTFEMHLRELINIKSIGGADDKYLTLFDNGCKTLHKRKTQITYHCYILHTGK